jgi:hypothetical protein
MPFTFTYDVPATEEMYRKIRALLPEDAPGLIVHLVVPHEIGLRHIGVWDSKAAWDAFHHDHIDPAVDEVLAGYGLEPNDDLTVFEELQLVDLWQP